MVSDGGRLREWFVPVDESEAAGDPGPAQRHVVPMIEDSLARSLERLAALL